MGKRGRTSDDIEECATGATSNTSVDWGEVTPVNAGERESFLFSPSATLRLSPGRVFQNEESILIAQQGAERYRCELEREIERSKSLVSQVSALESSQRSLQAELVALEESAATRERNLVKQLEMLSAEKRSEETQHLDIRSKLELQIRELQESKRQSENELEICKVREEGIKQELDDLRNRKNAAIEDSVRIMQTLCGTLKDNGGSSLENSRDVEDIIMLNKHLAKENQAAAQEVRACAQLRKEVERLRGIQDEADRHRSRSAKLQEVGHVAMFCDKRKLSTLRNASNSTKERSSALSLPPLSDPCVVPRKMLDAANAALAEAQRERALAEDWRLSAALALPDAATPADAARECVRLRERVLVLEGEVRLFASGPRYPARPPARPS